MIEHLGRLVARGLARAAVCAAACAGPGLAAAQAPAPAASARSPAASTATAPAEATAASAGRIAASAALDNTVASRPADRPLAALPYTPGLDPASMDRNADPCADFYRYSCGGWIDANPVPADESSWDVSAKLSQDNFRFLWGILDALSRRTEGRSPAQQQIGDHFAACMDEPAIEARGLASLQPLLDRIAGLRGKKDLPGLIAELQIATLGDMLFGFSAAQDFADSRRVIAFVSAGGISLPERDYYLRDDAKSVQLRADYLAHVARMLQLLGDAPDAAARAARAVLDIETALAKATLTPVQQRDSRKLMHPLDARGLQRLTPGFDWRPFLAVAHLAATPRFNATEPEFLRRVNQIVLTRSLADLQAYLRWHLVHAEARNLTAALAAENFAFFSKTLRGVPEPPPRWQFCVRSVDSDLGEALGQEYVRQAFGPALKARTLKMTQQIEDAMAAEIRQLDWMSPATRARALDKLRGIANKIGYPDRWRDYAEVEIRRDDHFGNRLRATQFEARRQFARIGKPLDRGEWQMTPPTVNAYYDAQMNDMNFPAGILQPPLFDPLMDDAPNYGNTGSTIGHELTHAFDDDGRQFDGHGNLRNWWAPADERAFNQRTQCLVDQYARYTVVDDIKINSRLTLGEDLADFGGLVIAMAAWRSQAALEPPPALRDGLTPLQRFFVGYAQYACGTVRPEMQRVLATSDPHSPPKYRVNGVVANIADFAQAFHCKPGQPLAPVKRCRVW